MKKLYLYLKESPLGLKYLGKTTRSPFEYSGSGLYWKRHLKKHNFKNSDIKTTILFESFSKDELRLKGIYYSELYDIVSSNEWANIRPETGDGGDTSGSPNYKKPPVFIGDKNWTTHMSDSQREKFSERMRGDLNPAKRDDVKHKISIANKGKKRTDDVKQSISNRVTGNGNPFFNHQHSATTKDLLKRKAIGRYTLDWFVSRYGDEDGQKKYQERRYINVANLDKLRKSGKNRKEYTCDICGLTGKGPNMKRYHFDNCKQLKHR